jgi:hypothetical protein
VNAAITITSRQRRPGDVGIALLPTSFYAAECSVEGASTAAIKGRHKVPEEMRHQP